MAYATEYLEVNNLPKCTQVIRVLESAEPTVFLQWFKPKVCASILSGTSTALARLFEVSDESGTMWLKEIANFKQKHLDGDDVMILDVRDIIYLWIGQGANENEKKTAKEEEEKYLKNDPLPRPAGAKIVIIQEGKEPSEFIKWFEHWDPNLWKTKKTFEDMKKLAIAPKKK